MASIKTASAVALAEINYLTRDMRSSAREIVHDEEDKEEGMGGGRMNNGGRDIDNRRTASDAFRSHCDAIVDTNTDRDHLEENRDNKDSDSNHPLLNCKDPSDLHRLSASNRPAGLCGVRTAIRVAVGWQQWQLDRLLDMASVQVMGEVQDVSNGVVGGLEGNARENRGEGTNAIEWERQTKVTNRNKDKDKVSRTEEVDELAYYSFSSQSEGLRRQKYLLFSAKLMANPGVFKK